ncbi:MAG: hypothetical protein Q8S33_11005 [Myxococcales bacterium]|nr:hypothetical protein [Myxococcales bacterium]
MTTTSTPRRATGLLIGCIPVPIIVFVALIFAAPGRLSCGELTGYTPAMLELIEACAPARERLGSPLHFTILGGGLGGNYKSGREAGEGFAYGRLEVKGPSATASVEYQLSKQNGQWAPAVLVLTFPDEKKVDVKACTSELLAKRQSEAGLATFRAQCAAGQADMCLTLGHLAKASGNAEEATRFFRQACELGAAAACQLNAP